MSFSDATVDGYICDLLTRLDACRAVTDGYEAKLNQAKNETDSYRKGQQRLLRRICELEDAYDLRLEHKDSLIALLRAEVKGFKQKYDALKSVQFVQKYFDEQDKCRKLFHENSDLKSENVTLRRERDNVRTLHSRVTGELSACRRDRDEIESKIREIEAWYL